jgi:hypothetical protein
VVANEAHDGQEPTDNGVPGIADVESGSRSVIQS